MKKKIFAAIAAGLMTFGLGTGVANASSLPAGSSAGSSAITAGANAPAGTVVKQGDRIRVIRGNTIGNCTLGYVDRRARIGYTAAHCGFPGEPVYNARNQVIGFYEQSNIIGYNLARPLVSVDYYIGNTNLIQGSDMAGVHDIARIRLIPSVVAGENGFSGDRIVPRSEIRRGDEICAVGSM